MVGVPRSQGCQECRKRKKGCDLTKPSCGRCLRMGTQCSYGAKRWTFVEQRAPSEGPQSEVVLRGQRSSIPRDQIAGPSTSVATGDSERHLQRTAFEVETLADFWERYLPREEPDTIYVGGVYAAPWSGTLLELSNNDESVKLALQACALVVRSRVTGGPEFDVLRSVCTPKHLDAPIRRCKIQRRHKVMPFLLLAARSQLTSCCEATRPSASRPKLRTGRSTSKGFAISSSCAVRRSMSRATGIRCSRIAERTL